MVTFFSFAASTAMFLDSNGTSIVDTARDAFSGDGGTSLPLRFAVLVATAYIVWLAAFESWIEPWVRSRVSSIVGYPVVWRGTGAVLRVWRDASGTLDGSGVVPLAGCTLVLCAAIFPAALIPSLLQWIAPGDVAVTAAGYLLAVPMTALFVLHIMAARPSDDVARVK